MRGRPKIADSVTIKAYEAWRRIGSVQGVAKEINVSPQVVRNWRDGIFNDWDKDPSAFEALKKHHAVNDISACQSQEAALLQSMLEKVNEVIADGEVKPKKWPEVLDTVKFVLDRLSKMVPTDPKDVASSEENLAEVKDLMDTMSKALGAGGKEAKEALEEYREAVAERGEVDDGKLI